MSLTTVGVEVKDDEVGTKNIELNGLVNREDELTIRGCKPLSTLAEQSTEGD